VTVAELEKSDRSAGPSRDARRPANAGREGSAQGLGVTTLLRLQRSAGNRAVAAAVAEHAGAVDSVAGTRVDRGRGHAGEAMATALARAVVARHAEGAAAGGDVMRTPGNPVARAKVMRDDVDPTAMTVTPEMARGLSDDALEAHVRTVRARLGGVPGDEGARQNLATLESEVASRTVRQLSQQDAYAEVSSPPMSRLIRATGTLQELGRPIPDDPLVLPIPGGHGLAIDDGAALSVMPGEGLVEIDPALFPVLEQLVSASSGGPPPAVGDLGQVILWPDGRAVETPPMNADLATLLVNGQPAHLDVAMGASLQSPWQRVRDSSLHGLFGTGVYQLGTYPISRLNGVSLPAGTRIRFADPRFPLRSQTRVLTLFQPGTKRFYAWDAHLPVGNTTHPYWHVNQKGMHGLFGQADHAAMTPAQIAQGRQLRYLKIGGRAFLIIGVAVDAYQLGSAGAESIERGTPRPVVAQAVRTVGGWGGAWAGAKLGCMGAGLAGIETGPGAALFCIAGGAVGGFAGYYGADWIADMIEED
jgi:hypothetical protein